MSDDDAELVALIDNELDESAEPPSWRVWRRTSGLRQRYEELRQTSAPLAASFDALLRQAPLARLRAALPAGRAASSAVKALRWNCFPRAGGRPCHRGSRSGRRPMGRIDLWAV